MAREWRPWSSVPLKGGGEEAPRPFICALFLVASLIVTGAALAEDTPPDQVTAVQMMEDLMYGHGTVGGPFTLTDQFGHQRSDTDFRGKLMIVYFGYTFCPDVCPADLMTISHALDALGAEAAQVQPIFITIDPARDTKLLAEYVSAFHKSLIGLTGSPEEIREVANAYKAFYASAPATQDGEYAIDHTGVIYLMGRDGEYLGFMPPQTDPNKLTEILRKYLSSEYPSK